MRSGRDDRKNHEEGFIDQNNRSFVEAIRKDKTESANGRVDHTEHASSLSWFGSRTDEEWLWRSAVGELKEFKNIEAVNSKLESKGFIFSSVYLGGKRIMWTFESDYDRDGFIKMHSFGGTISQGSDDTGREIEETAATDSALEKGAASRKKERREKRKKDRFKEGPFGQYLEMIQPIRVHGMLIYNLLKRQFICPEEEKDDEMWFGLGEKKARFAERKSAYAVASTWAHCPKGSKKKKKSVRNLF
ncbi:hypothetical protein LWI29_007262 [Acer saccharum]|uniref:Uncharacterized protein n=1 Tax=Acer saccharum TaxID=4024 RepID=A0AA39SRM3_ACESA|nr:hypothetical protein LWI29_007262 [Acer saccharum]